MKARKVTINDFVGHKHPASKLYRVLELQAIYELTKNINFKNPSLDLGCGDGYLSNILFDKKFSYGLDNNEAGDVAVAKNKKLYEKVLIQGAEKMSLKDNSLNFVFSNSVLEHIPSLDLVLAEVSRVLKPGGYFLLSMPSDKFYDYLGFNNWYRKYRNIKLNHYHLYSIKTWKQKLLKNNFKVLDYVYEIDKKTLNFWDKLVIKTKLLGIIDNFAKEKIYAENYKKIKTIIKNNSKKIIGANITILAQKI